MDLIEPLIFSTLLVLALCLIASLLASSLSMPLTVTPIARVGALAAAGAVMLAVGLVTVKYDMRTEGREFMTGLSPGLNNADSELPSIIFAAGTALAAMAVGGSNLIIHLFTPTYVDQPEDEAY
ncbi:hypothetical protein DFS34DRAFT_184516 [Phlyctochytrium arcticum]|nr:hypothetical protein DFS34DRAFT_184516 [Phlyctochytrium arcticum]